MRCHNSRKRPYLFYFRLQVRELENAFTQKIEGAMREFSYCCSSAQHAHEK